MFMLFTNFYDFLVPGSLLSMDLVDGAPQGFTFVLSNVSSGEAFDIFASFR